VLPPVKVFGCDTNSKGFRKPRGCGVIQGDGINITTLGKIMDAVLDAGYSAEVSGCDVEATSAVSSCGLDKFTKMFWLVPLCQSRRQHHVTVYS
jgi:hypothetical protein